MSYQIPSLIHPSAPMNIPLSESIQSHHSHSHQQQQQQPQHSLKHSPHTQSQSPSRQPQPQRLSQSQQPGQGEGGQVQGQHEGQEERPKKKRQRGQGRKHECDYPQCGKEFTRMDHLQRHQLNHTQNQIHSCPRCDRTFVRSDLLLRHSLRHDQRDRRRRYSTTSSLDPQAPNPTASTSPQDLSRPVDRVLINTSAPSHPTQPGQTGRMEDDTFLLSMLKSPISEPSTRPQQIYRVPPQTQHNQMTPEISHPLLTTTINHNTNPSPEQQAFFPRFVSHPFLNAGSSYNWLLDDTSLGVFDHQLEDLQWTNSMDLSRGNRDQLPPTPVASPQREEVEYTPRDMLDSNTHTRLLDLANASQYAHVLTKPHVQSYIDLYWLHFHSQYPILHRPSFVPALTPVALLLSIVIVGTFYAAEDEAHAFAIAVCDKLRGSVMGCDEFKAECQPWVLQTLLLTELFGKMMSNRPQHELAHIFHGSLITLARRSCVFAPVHKNVEDESIEGKWKAWVHREALKRLAFFAFMCDTQHATIFRQTALMSAFELHLSLPVDEDLWDCPTSQKWALRITERNGGTGNGINWDKPVSTPKFLDTLKGSFLPGRAVAFLNPFSRFIVLHGLLSVCWDIQWRGQVFVSVTGSAATDPTASRVESLLPNALSTWMTRLDSNFHSDPSTAMQMTVWSCASLHCSAYLALYADLIELQIYAGTKSVLGRKIQPSDRQKADTNIKEWAVKGNGAVATWHAVTFLRSCLLKYMQPYHQSRRVDLEAPHHARCVYLAVLTAWAYGHAVLASRKPASAQAASGQTSAQGQAQRVERRGEDTRWDEAMGYCDAVCLSKIGELADVVVRNRTDGVVGIIGVMLMSSRWEISRESAVVLNNLPN